jgi:hypothetical protein
MSLFEENNFEPQLKFNCLPSAILAQVGHSTLHCTSQGVCCLFLCFSVRNLRVNKRQEHIEQGSLFRKFGSRNHVKYSKLDPLLI